MGGRQVALAAFLGTLLRLALGPASPSCSSFLRDSLRLRGEGGSSWSRSSCRPAASKVGD